MSEAEQPKLSDVLRDRREKLEEMVEDQDSLEGAGDSTEIADGEESAKSHPAGAPHANRFYLRSPQVWDDVLAAVGTTTLRR